MHNLNIKPLIFAFFSCFLFISAAKAQEYPQDFSFKGYYKVNYTGILIGKLGVEFNQTATSYSATGDIVSAGLLKRFTKHSSHSTVTASGKNFSYDSVNYVTDYQTKKKKRHVEIAYEDGKFIKQTLIPPESATKRKPVAQALKDTSFDPLSGIIEARSKLRAALASGEKNFSVNAYDGRRLSTIYFTVMDKEVIKVYDVKYPVIKVKARRELIAGFSKSELEKHDPNEPDLYLYFSDDATLFPVRLEFTIYAAKLQANLMLRCGPNQSCLLGNKN